LIKEDVYRLLIKEHVYRLLIKEQVYRLLIKEDETLESYLLMSCGNTLCGLRFMLF